MTVDSDSPWQQSARVVALTRDAMLLFGAMLARHGQDFLPGYVAAILLRSDELDAVYLPAGASNLFEVAPAFAMEAARHSSLPSEGLTAFVASPPALLMYFPFGLLSFPYALKIWALIMAVAMVVSFRRLTSSLPVEARPVFVVSTFGMVPLLLWTLLMGQSSPLLLLLAALLVVRSGRAADLAAGILLASITALKAFPAFFLPIVLLLGRPVVAVSAILGLGFGVFTALWWVPWTAYARFVEAIQAVSSGVVTHPFNLSAEAVIARAWFGASDHVVVLGGVLGVFALMVKMVLLWTALVGAWTSLSAERRWSCIWLLLLTLLPLLWIHYLVVLPALLVPAFRERDWRRWSAVGSMGLLGLAILTDIEGPWMQVFGIFGWALAWLAIVGRSARREVT